MADARTALGVHDGVVAGLDRAVLEEEVARAAAAERLLRLVERTGEVGGVATIGDGLALKVAVNSKRSELMRNCWQLGLACWSMKDMVVFEGRRTSSSAATCESAPGELVPWVRATRAAGSPAGNVERGSMIRMEGGSRRGRTRDRRAKRPQKNAGPPLPPALVAATHATPTLKRRSDRARWVPSGDPGAGPSAVPALPPGLYIEMQVSLLTHTALSHTRRSASTQPTGTCRDYRASYRNLRDLRDRA